MEVVSEGDYCTNNYQELYILLSGVTVLSPTFGAVFDPVYSFEYLENYLMHCRQHLV